VPSPTKATVHQALLEHLRVQVGKMAELARDTASAVTHEDNRSEGSKDMRATEQSYIARGQAMRTEELADALGRLEAFEPPSYQGRPLGAGALVKAEVEGESEARWLYVIAWGAGTELSIANHRVMVITPSSPVGRLLMGKEAGDVFEFAQPGGKRREWVIESIE